MLTTFFTGFFLGSATILLIWFIVENRRASKACKELKEAIEDLEKTVKEAEI